MTHWRTQPRLKINDVSPAVFHNYQGHMTEVSSVAMRRYPVLDLKPRQKNDHASPLFPIMEAKRSANLWNSFKLNSTTSRLPFVEKRQVPAIVDYKEASLPLEKPHAIALGLATLLITLGILSFKL